jgi:hypothetical protein
MINRGKALKIKARPAGFEPATCGFEECFSYLTVYTNIKQEQ